MGTEASRVRSRPMPSAVCACDHRGSEPRNARPDNLDLRGACSRPSAEAQLLGRAYAIMRAQGEAVSASEGARHVGRSQAIRADLPDKALYQQLNDEPQIRRKSLKRKE